MKYDPFPGHQRTALDLRPAEASLRSARCWSTAPTPGQRTERRSKFAELSNVARLGAACVKTRNAKLKALSPDLVPDARQLVRKADHQGPGSTQSRHSARDRQRRKNEQLTTGVIRDPHAVAAALLRVAFGRESLEHQISGAHRLRLQLRDADTHGRSDCRPIGATKWC